MKTTVEITRAAMLSFIKEGVAQELKLRPDVIKSPKLTLAKGSRGKHTFVFETTEPIPLDERPDLA